MAYIPPHKRHLKEGNISNSPPTLSPTPIPESLVPHFKRGLNFKTSLDQKRKYQKKTRKVIYGPKAISRWFPVGFADDDDNTQFVNLTCLETVTSESFVQNIGENVFILVLDDDRLKEYSDGRRVFSENPWTFVASNVKHDFLLAFQRIKSEIRDDNDKHVVAKPLLVARFGKVLFRGSLPTEESSGRSLSPESLVHQFKRLFHTHVTLSYMDYIVNDAVPKLGLELNVEKDFFAVKLSDNTRPDLTISCKCTWSKNNEQPELYQIEWNPLRHLVVDVSGLERKTDLRLMLCAKRVMMDIISDDEMKGIKNLISSAIVDPEVKGGLRWPLGKGSSGDRYTVVGVWHIRSKSFRSLSITLKVRHADRFDFRYSSGEVSREIIVKMPNIFSEKEGQTIDEEHLGEMLENNLKLLWDACLCYEADPVFE